MNSQNNTVDDRYKDDDEADQLPGFRFHPTDEELVGFYLRRKVDKKLLSNELIKQIDIYKHDPWDLPKISSTADKEGYFFCKRGRKYRNSIRPNRVTGSGFWKATGIDKPVYSRGGEGGHECIGLKKTLVYYVGCARKGNKTDWMMNEFRLPSNDSSSNSNNVTNETTTMPEAEVWTICRIFKRNMSTRKYTAEWREQLSAKRQSSAIELPSSTEAYISFDNPGNIHHHNDKLSNTMVSNNPHESIIASSSSYIPNSYGYDHRHELLAYENWDELKSVVDFAFGTSLM